MMEEEFKFEYINEDDRAYGLAGMAISAASLDALDRITEIDLDAEGTMIRFAGDYYYPSSPAVSPKVVWNNLLRNLHLTASMVLGNVMARTMVRLGSEPLPEVYDKIREVVKEEGRYHCSLEDEETDILFERVMRNNRRIFCNPRVHPAVEHLAGVISRRRRLSVLELAEQLEMLG